MKVRSLVAVFCCILMGVAFCTSSYAADYKVGFINLARLVTQSNIGKEAQKKIQKLREEKQSIADAKLSDLQKFQKFIKDEGPKMPDEERRKKQEAFQQAYKEYQRLIADAKDDIAREDRELVAMILGKAQDIVKSLAKKNNYAIILKDANAIGYLDPEVDITDEVVKELNRRK